MRSYRQYCPIARAAEVLAEPWTPIIVRNLIEGADTFAAQLDAAPGLSRSTLVRRLADLERSGVLQADPKPHGRGNAYHLTVAGNALAPVLLAMGNWAEEHLGLDPTTSDPGFLLHNWASRFLAVDELPDQRILVRFDFADHPRPDERLWVVFDRDHAEVCVRHPGGDDDLIVRSDSVSLTEWHVGHVEWTQLLRSERLSVHGPPCLARQLPTWNLRSPWTGAAPGIHGSAGAPR